ncbi:MAG: hypothetical protein A3H43_04975 [Gammaproteobacteria bacterium RIFCSPLOWO2_02_FULL_42_9]|nr:MAG: hypothetical protein A3H43_04975 [Gammaproteobacteria bacterium RIFCSPLOWO2_02_FULL_42_9]
MPITRQQQKYLGDCACLLTTTAIFWKILQANDRPLNMTLAIIPLSLGFIFTYLGWRNSIMTTTTQPVTGTTSESSIPIPPTPEEDERPVAAHQQRGNGEELTDDTAHHLPGQISGEPLLTEERSERAVESPTPS